MSKNNEMTKKSFQSSSILKHYLKPMYRTGDLVKEDKGLLYFKGRIDNQIKHMGYRIELEEIEIALSKLNYIIQAVTIYKRENLSFGKIFAYVSLSRKMDSNEIKKDLEDILPIYMIPNVIVELKELPKNANGKVDRKKLMKNVLSNNK